MPPSTTDSYTVIWLADLLILSSGGRTWSFLPTTCLPDWNSDLRPRLGLLWLAVIGGEDFRRGMLIGRLLLASTTSISEING